MGNLDELMERMKIEFPFPITADEVEYGLFDSLRRNTSCNVLYNFNTLGAKSKKEPSLGDERYVSEFKGTFTRSQVVASTFEMPVIYHPELPITFFKSIKFFIVPGYDSVQEFESLPTGKEQLRMIDEIRFGVKEYFSQRPK